MNEFTMGAFGWPDEAAGPQDIMLNGTDAGMTVSMGWPAYDAMFTQNMSTGMGGLDANMDSLMASVPGCGAYTPFQADYDKLIRLGFCENDIATMETIVRAHKNRFPNSYSLSMLGINGKQATMLKYMYCISVGRVLVENREQLVKHLKKMWEGRHIGIQDLPVSKTTMILRFAVVSGLPAPFNVLNSKQYMQGAMRMEGIYEVVSTGTTNTVIKTKRKPVLKFGDSKEIPGVISIINGPDEAGVVQYSINNRYVRMCNRYVIVAALRRPDDHLGCKSILCIDGTTVYVMAKALASGNKTNYYSTTQRIYRYGVLGAGIEKNLNDVAKWLYDGLSGVYVEHIPGTMVYDPIIDNEAMELERRQSAESSLADEFDTID